MGGSIDEELRETGGMGCKACSAAILSTKKVDTHTQALIISCIAKLVDIGVESKVDIKASERRPSIADQAFSSL